MAAPAKRPRAKGWSSPATTRRVVELLVEHCDELGRGTARVADVGAGRGALSHALCELLRARGHDPRGRVLPCDASPGSFEVDEVECLHAPVDRPLPYADGSVDAAAAVEVIEHVEDPFAFVRELARVTRPGGLVVVTTPNVAHVGSRLRALATGFPQLFDPLPLGNGDPRLLSGHIHPLPPYYLALTALRAGLVEPRLVHDRTKRSAALATVLLAPVLAGGALLQRRRLAAKRADVLRENDALLRQITSWGLLTGRSAVLSARKPRLAS